MPHEYLLDAIEAAKTKNPHSISQLEKMILNGRKSTSKHGLGWIQNGGIRPTELFTPLSNGDNIFHLLAEKKLISEILPKIKDAFNAPHFVQRERLQYQLGLTGKSLTPTEVQINNLLKKYLTQPNHNSKTVWDISCPADKEAIKVYLPREERLTIASAAPATVPPADPNAALKTLIKNLADHLQSDNNTLKIITPTLGSNYNNLQLFIHLHNEFGQSFANMIMAIGGTPFLDIDDFFNKLFTITPLQDFKTETGKGMDAFSLICYHKDTWLAQKLLSCSKNSLLQREHINKALFYDSSEILEEIVKHYKTQTDWQLVLYKSIEHGRPEVIEKYLSNITPLTNDSVTFKTPTGSKGYTSHTYILHMLRVVQEAISKKEARGEDITTDQAKLNRIFDCWKMIKSTINLEDFGAMLSKAINKLPNEIKEQITEDDIALFNSIMEYEPAESSRKSAASAAFSDRTDFARQTKSGFLVKKSAKQNIFTTSKDYDQEDPQEYDGLFRYVPSPDHCKTDSQDEVSTFNSDIENILHDVNIVGES